MMRHAIPLLECEFLLGMVNNVSFSSYIYCGNEKYMAQYICALNWC